jgi:hypothetical protein
LSGWGGGGGARTDSNATSAIAAVEVVAASAQPELPIRDIDKRKQLSGPSIPVEPLDPLTTRTGQCSAPTPGKPHVRRIPAFHQFNRQ